jgi:(2Fe-2S) ferredoxin
LICSHASRDSRCGILGPILHDEFKKYLAARTDPTIPNMPFRPNHNNIFEPRARLKYVNVGMISHIGGHKWAGNVIIYFPPTHGYKVEPANPLSGLGVWYGRVEPKHVEGIVEETLVKGQIIKELFRGALNREGKIERL